MTDEKQVTNEEKIVSFVLNDFSKRQEERRFLERGWQLNMNFAQGNQYCDVNSRGEIFEEGKDYFWQFRRVFNHVSSMLDYRCSKLGRIRPALIVTPKSDDEKDRKSARIASAVLAATVDCTDLDGVISAATVWSETCGTAFYKVIWNGLGGASIGINSDGRKLKQGEVQITAVSPFEIYPYDLQCESIDEQPSIIQAKAVPVQDIYKTYGVKVIEGGENYRTNGVGIKEGYALVIERYERPSEDRPQGRVIVVAGNTLLYDGELPYINGEDGERCYPFIKQTALPRAGSFFGTSVIDRLIPLQRAYNAVKNRKHEFLNRLTMGIVAVEDGSVDIDELAEDGLNPGKVLIYRKGAKPPEMLALGSVPAEFEKEEERLLKEFTKVSGTGDISENADSFAGITSATGLQLILDQDEIRMEFAYQQVRRALKIIGRHVLRLYRQFATDIRFLRTIGKEDKMGIVYFKGSDLSSDDVYLEADNEANLSQSQRREIVYGMLDRGLFYDNEGKLTPTEKRRIFELLGYKGSQERDIKALNKSRAEQENIKMRKEIAEVKEYDDHDEHIKEHTAFLLSENLTSDIEKRICSHIDIHRQKIKEN